MVCHFNGKTSAFQPTTLPSILLQILIQKSEKKTKKNALKLTLWYHNVFFCLAMSLFLLLDHVSACKGHSQWETWILYDCANFDLTEPLQKMLQNWTFFVWDSHPYELVDTIKHVNVFQNFTKTCFISQTVVCKQGSKFEEHCTPTEYAPSLQPLSKVVLKQKWALCDWRKGLG